MKINTITIIALMAVVTTMGLDTNNAIAIGSFNHHHHHHIIHVHHHHHHHPIDVFTLFNVFNDFNNRNNGACFQYPWVLSPHFCAFH
ncbi:MAG TPA: hypothetical protein VN704_07170 [Verrucomicrobiae bacterium]|nr:hypothetical protein [Verrucomicrobiae bacterium]